MTEIRSIQLPCGWKTIPGEPSITTPTLEVPGKCSNAPCWTFRKFINLAYTIPPGMALPHQLIKFNFFAFPVPAVFSFLKDAAFAAGGQGFAVVGKPFLQIRDYRLIRRVGSQVGPFSGIFGVMV